MCTAELILFLGYNTKKKKYYLKEPGNSGWLRLTFTDLENPVKPKQKTVNFYNKYTEISARNMSVSLGDMQLTMLQGGQIKVRIFNSWQKLNEKHKHGT